jgi:hypothetical protein
MGRGNPNIKNIPHRGRKAKGSEPFYFIINDKVRVTKDSYQYVIAQKNTTKENKSYEVGELYYNTLECLVKDGLPKYNIPQADIDKFVDRSKGITQSFSNGKMIVNIPSTTEFDIRDIVPEDTDEGENTSEE